MRSASASCSRMRVRGSRSSKKWELRFIAAAPCSLSKKSLRDFSPSCFQNCKMKFCSIILQFCRCGGLLNAKGNPDGFLSHFSSLRNLRLGRFFDSLSQPAWRSRTAMQADNFCGIFAALILWHKASGFVIARAFAILTKPCANREFCAGAGCPLSYRARALLSRRIQKSDRLIWASRSGFYGNTA